MTLSQPVWRAIALVVGAAFFVMATRTEVYNATSPPGLSRQLFGPDVLQLVHPWWFSLHIWLRKAYSIIAFAVVGFTVNRSLNPASRPALRAALVVGVYSLGIEVAQRLLIGIEPVGESVLDVGCGALGGWLSVWIDRWTRIRPIGRRSGASQFESAAGFDLLPPPTINTAEADSEHDVV